MQEDNHDKCRTEILDGEEIDMEERTTESAPIRKLVAHQLVRQIPSHHQTCEESAYGQEHLTSDKVEDVEQRLAKETHHLISSERQRTDGAKHTARYGDYQCRLLATDVQFLVEESRAHLMQRDKRREGCQRQ